LDVEYNFSNKVVLITGGTGALGSTLVKKFIDSGAITISSFVNDEGAKRLKTANHKVELIKLDITKEEQILKTIPILFKNLVR